VVVACDFTLVSGTGACAPVSFAAVELGLAATAAGADVSADATAARVVGGVACDAGVDSDALAAPAAIVDAGPTTVSPG
jgi:hypothetical protein